ncbi:MAG: hypothetical protein V3S64_13880 [bacterium]
MPLKFTEGDTFPDHTLTDHGGAELSISQVAEKRPLILAFYRGPW